MKHPNVAALVAVIGICSVPLPSRAATYYVDSVSGNDANSGIASGAALKSIAKVNSLSLMPGDSVLFRRGRTFAGVLDIQRSGSSASPITLGAFDSGAAPVISEIYLRGSYLIVEDFYVDHQRAASDAVRVRSAHNCVLRNMVVTNGTRDAIDVNDADGLLIENVEIHHFLNGSFGSEDDAHGVVAVNTNGITIRGADIHHVSGDSFQADPGRTAGSITTNIVIENSVLWTGPLEANFNSGWQAGDSPGENAIDTKVLQSGYESHPRMSISFRNVTAHGWTAVPEIPNRAAFNLKEKITAVVDGVTVYNSEIAFRIRGSLGNADTVIRNAVIYDVGKAIRAEDNLANLKVYHATFGNGITSQLEFAGGSGGVATWDIRNNAFVGTKPAQATDASNLLATSADFVAAAQRNYQLSSGSSMIDRGVALPGVMVDRNGASRSGVPDVGAFEYATSVLTPMPPDLTLVQ